MDLNDLLAQESVLRSRLERCIDNGKKTAIAKRTQGFYEAKTTELNKLFEEYSATDLQIIKLIKKEALEATCEYVQEDHFGTIEGKYSEYLGDLCEGLRKLKGVMISSSSNADATNASGNTIIMQQTSPLPKIVLPKFNGDYDTWRSFHDLFVSVIHNNVQLSSVQKFHHLKASLTGDAERLLRHIPLTEQDYEPAWLKLKERFENTRILVDHQLKILVNQPKLNVESNKGLKTLAETTDECLQQLKGLGVDTTSWDALLVHIIVQKLPFVTMKLWKEELGSQKELPRFTQLVTFLDTRLKILESITDAVGPKTQHSTLPIKQRTASFHVGNNGKCPICRGPHFINRCEKYKGMTLQTKQRTIRNLGLCGNCLAKNHSQSECTSKYRCFKCNQAHHTSLHQDVNGQLFTNKLKAERDESTLDQAVAVRTNCVQPTAGPKVTQALISRQGMQALLSTALITVQGNNGQESVLRCLIDPGSESSFLTEDACKRIGARWQPTTIAITGIGNNPVATTRKETTLRLFAREATNPIIEETFFILNTITNCLPRRKIHKKNFQHLEGLQLADPTF